MTRAELRVFLVKHFCYCGSPDLAAGALLRLLRLHPLYSHQSEFEEWIPDQGVETLLLYQLDHMGLTEHGGTVKGAWLTDLGEAVRDALVTEAANEFEELFEMHCIHGFDVEDPDHVCSPE